MMNQYSVTMNKSTGYQILIITPFAFETGFDDLVNYYSSVGLTTQFESVEVLTPVYQVMIFLKKYGIISDRNTRTTELNMSF